MMPGLIQPVRGLSPSIDPSCFIAPTANIIGDVTIGEQSSVWYHTVLRGDVHSICIGRRCNIQDGVIIHCTYQRADVRLGDNVSVGHRATLHGCHIDDNVLVGMHALIMDQVYVPSFTLIAAGALIPPGMKLESGYIYAGLPAKKMRKLTPRERQDLIEGTASNYVKYSLWYQPPGNKG